MCTAKIRRRGALACRRRHTCSGRHMRCARAPHGCAPRRPPPPRLPHPGGTPTSAHKRPSPPHQVLTLNDPSLRPTLLADTRSLLRTELLAAVPDEQAPSIARKARRWAVMEGVGAAAAAAAAHSPLAWQRPRLAPPPTPTSLPVAGLRHRVGRQRHARIFSIFGVRIR